MVSEQLAESHRVTIPASGPVFHCPSLWGGEAIFYNILGDSSSSPFVKRANLARSFDALPSPVNQTSSLPQLRKKTDTYVLYCTDEGNQ